MVLLNDSSVHMLPIVCRKTTTTFQHLLTSQISLTSTTLLQPASFGPLLTNPTNF